MNNIIEKLKSLKEADADTEWLWRDWSAEDQLQLLELYLLISKKEADIFELIYSYHGCDSWEDIFRDYSNPFLREKARGVEIAVDELKQRIINGLDSEDDVWFNGLPHIPTPTQTFEDCADSFFGTP